MASNNDIRELMAARREGRVTKKPGVPQDDPADIASRTQEVPPMIEEPALEAQAGSSEQGRVDQAKPVEKQEQVTRPSTVIRGPRLLPVDKTAALVPFSSYLYPDRKRQLKQEAVSEGKDLYEILDEAVEKYFEDRYGKTT